jgi:hypothetical protein
MDELASQYAPLPADDLKRNLTIAQIDQDEQLPHIGLVGDTYTIIVNGAETAGRFCVIDMHIPLVEGLRHIGTTSRRPSFF